MIKKIIVPVVGVVVILLALGTAFAWFKCRVYVPYDKCAVLIRKTGEKLPSGQIVGTEPNQKGIQEAVLGPGRHFFYDPFRWDWYLAPLTEIEAGNPKTWEWIHSLDERQRAAIKAGSFTFKGEFPMVGVVTRKVGQESSDGSVFVERGSGYKGIWRQVLTPGVYKLNPEVFEVHKFPAVVIPAGFVGVVTNLFGDQPSATSAAESEPSAEAPQAPDVSEGAAPEDAEPEGAAPAGAEQSGTEQAETAPGSSTRPLALAGNRGTLREVLQPGVYFINPKLQKIVPVEIGYNEYSQIKVSEIENNRIAFSSETGFLIRVGVTIVWGIHPKHAAEIINEFGNTDGVLDKIIAPQLRSICRNIGSTYAARDFIQGARREQFQRDLTNELKRVCGEKNVDVLLALVREVEVHSPSATESGDVTEDLKRTIQESYIADERRITMEKKREAATVKARLEEEQKKIDIERETIQAETRIKVADIEAEGEKDAAEIQAQTNLEVATIRQQAATLEAKRTEILGQAAADVERYKNEAEAEGYALLVHAFGTPRAYNLYTFAENFEPKSIRLFFAGEGTFWTDLSRFEDAGAARLLQDTADPRP